MYIYRGRLETYHNNIIIYNNINNNIPNVNGDLIVEFDFLE
jgi:hypothetical protein